MLIKDAVDLPRHCLSDKSIGVEIEVEGRNLPHNLLHWREDYDGSLRGENVEYVLRKPMDLTGVKAALKELQQAYVDNGSVIDDSVRAGVHVHINVQDLSVVEMYTFLTSYLVMENLLVKFCGKHREGNLFCLRTQDAEYSLEMYRQSIEKDDIWSLDTENLRYGSLNPTSLFKYGTLEFRAMRSTKHFGLVSRWVSMLLHLREKSKEYKSPIHVIESFSEGGERAFLSNLMGRHSERLGRYKGFSRLLREGVRKAQDVAYSTLDWEKLNQIEDEDEDNADLPMEAMLQEWDEVDKEVDDEARKALILEVERVAKKAPIELGNIFAAL